ncbi:MAG TPA: hypothetical protein VMG41_15190 [Gemmatimonadales bacterium]|nr:hypothetical protein [Gemmatimonadales bacterium]
MTHLTLEELVALREPGLEPGLASAREHLTACPLCQSEAARLDQRSARLRALPSLRPARDRWSAISGVVTAERRRRHLWWTAAAGAAMAAGMLVVVAARHSDRQRDRELLAIDSVRARSTQLEHLIQSYNPDARVTDGTTALVAGQLEDRIAQVDQQLERTEVTEPMRDGELLQLWRQRVGLLNALVDVHLTRASQVGF